MRHDLLLSAPVAVAPGASRVRKAARAAVLVAPSCRMQRRAPGLSTARERAVALPTIAASAHQHLRLAARACVHPGETLPDLVVLGSRHRRSKPTPSAAAACLTPWTTPQRRCHTAHALV